MLNRDTLLDHDSLLEQTESYLKRLIGEACTSLGSDFDSFASFGELDIDSFRVLKIVKSLEADFGTLPKTLLFENFNVDALARYFVDKHATVLSNMAMHNGGKNAAKSVSAPMRGSPPPKPQPTPVPRNPLSPIRLLERDLSKHPQLAERVRELFERYKSEGGVSRGTRLIAPHLFIGSEQRGYFNYGRCKTVVLVYAYTGPDDYFPAIAQEMYQYCVERNLQLNIFADAVIESIGAARFSSTPFGVLQRVLNLRNFSLEGGAMRRLRYQVSKFEKAGACRTIEYKSGTDRSVDESIAAIIDQWCAGKPMVNPLVHIVKQEILAGCLHSQHRLFLTYVDEALQNVILVSALSSTHNGYLMDLEFYPPQMPLGGLEFAIVRIIETLAAEGRDLLSLGGTYGCRLTASPQADPGIDKILDDLHKQNIFNDEGNLQFKNKFRPENRTIYLCRPVDSGPPDNVIDIIMMIADPAKGPSAEEDDRDGADVPSIAKLPQPSTATKSGPAAPASCSTVSTQRSQILAECGFNPLNLPPERIDFDLSTDSWAQLKLPAIDKQMAHLRSQLQQPSNVVDSLKAIFPFEYFVLTDAGRTAEHLLCKAWPHKGVVPQNLLFPTGIYHQIDNGLTPCELPHPDVFQRDSPTLYKGDLALSELQAQVDRDAAAIAFVCIEVGNNAAGGQPVSMEHLRQVKELLASHSIPLVIDATRILENAQHLIEREHAGKSLWTVAREILGHADVVVASLSKDFCINKGGVIATHDETLLRRLQDLAQQEGGGLDVIDKRLIAAALQQQRQIETRVLRRMEAVRSIASALQTQGVPISQPVGGHCILIDVKRMPEFKGFEHPVPSFLAWLYLNTGIRAGAHSVGMQKHSAINDQVRLAIPVGLSAEDVNAMIERVVHLFSNKANIPEIAPEGCSAEAFGDVHANYRLIKYHAISTPAVSHADAAAAAAIEPDATSTPAAPILDAAPPRVAAVSSHSSSVQTAPLDIAVVGMAGRYPKASNLEQFWDNLRQGRDCVDEIPSDRIARRKRHAFTRSYRGGFLENVDKFDSLFFNISPREAEVLDPQERLFLEVAWEAIEDAGYHPQILVPENAPRNVGVFVGAVWSMYQIIGAEQKLAGSNVNPNSFLWSIANRVSYWMNLSGPSMTVDTACSSSLTALYLACEAIRKGDCSSAIVGGVNLDLHQHKFDINAAGGALSSDGVCRSFGAGANGYVAGEGVGAVLIKPLAQALEDRDHIYGVIKSVVVNHGGRTSGYTVPNPKAQAELISAALQQASVDARSIGFVEAHGTGTELGDPIEISGLASAFEADHVAHQSCPIGSVKTNIGHLEAAAGIVGVCKVLLQMKHRELVPSLHSSKLNEHIDFEQSPFYVEQKLEAWQQKEIDGVKLPLRAGISSFGAGGANAHVILEHHVPVAIEAAPPSDACIVPLSARNEEQLREMVQRLCRHLEREDAAPSFADIAFTLQTGRKSFEHRVAIVARTNSELLAKLRSFAAGHKDSDVLTGHAKNADGITKLLSRREKEQFVELLRQSRDPHKLAQLWIDGLLSDCRSMPHEMGRRVSLPTYPFADKRHWIAAGATTTVAATLRPGLHPLIDSNESTFQRQLFKKTFHAEEFFIRDHLVADVPTLPGVAYLDLARKAGEIAAGRKVQKIKNVTWVSPLTVDGAGATEALIELKPGPDAVHFEVFGESEAGHKRLYSQGKLVYAAEQASSPAEYIDLAAIRARCTQTVAGKDAYPLFKSVGLSYGPSFQVLQEVVKNDDEVLGLLQLPDVRGADFEEFALHPSLLDASMQAGVVGQLGDAAGEMKIPYSIGELELLHPLTPTCYSYVTRVKRDRNSSAGVTRENVTIVDEDGKVLARIRESVGVPLHGAKEEPAQIVAEPETARLYYSHTWQEAPLGDAQDAVNSILLFDVDQRLRDACRKRNVQTVLVLPANTFEAVDRDTYRIDPREPAHYTRLFAALRDTQRDIEKICYAWAARARAEDAAALDSALDQGVHSFLLLCQALIEQKPSNPTLIQYVYWGSEGTTQPHHDAMNAFARTLQLENPKLQCKVLEVRQATDDVDGIVNAVRAEYQSSASDAATVRYEEGVRYVRRLRALDLRAADGPPPLKEQGIYLITGGAGGLGLIFAEFLAQRYKAKLVLTGRSDASDELNARLEQLRRAGAEVLYVRADVAQAEDVRRLLTESKSRFGSINGIIHAAGVLRDSYLRKKTRTEIAAVLAPKVYGTFHLDQQTSSEDLDFFVLFSSLAAIGGNTGQCDYAFANHYMDSFAAARESLRERGQRSGRTVSLNWSLWADGGMKLDEQTELFFRRNLGITPLRKDAGLDGFTLSLRSDQPHVAVLEGVQAKIEQAWGLTKKPTSSSHVGAQQPSTGVGNEGLSGLVMQELSRIVLELLKLDAEELSLDSILVDLGFDSIGLTTFANAINDKYQLDINPVLFFEHPSIRAIADVLASEHASAVQRVHAGGRPNPPTEVTASKAVQFLERPTDASVSIAIDKSVRVHSSSAATEFSREQRFVREPIAIVGIAGVMPQSQDLETFWDHLQHARNLVTEIPRDRWIWEDYDGNPVKETNKSNSRWGGFMPEIDKFDPLFFGITPREAEMMDPQQRVFLETVWRAIEDSGHKVSDLSGTRTGLFVGASAKDYIDVLAEHQAALDGFSASGNSHSILANRVSFLLNLRGPSAPIDTACSSSLIALHRAIESIHTGSSDMAIVGGVQVMLTPIAHISLSSAGMLSVDGKCKTFDKNANGYVRGEGAGAIFIKPLAKAIADGNPIYAVIKSTAENHGGRVTMLTAPNPKAQAELLIEAYEKAHVDPTTIGYIECHGTGTSLGDPIEIQALKKAFADLYRKHGKAPPQAPHCGLSSVKTNIGHLEPAAGIASLLKVLLAMKHQQIPALLHFAELNPYIDLKGSPFYIVDKTTEWEAPRAEEAVLPRRAGVSSFGWGGANAHVVLEEYLAPPRQLMSAAGPQLIVLSARNEDRLKAYASALLTHLEQHPAELIDLAYTLQVGRDAMEERLGLIVHSRDELMQKLTAFIAGEQQIEHMRRGRVSRYKRNDQGLSVLAQGETTSASVSEWVAERNFVQLLGAWVDGADVDWTLLHSQDTAGKPRRVSLPTYPFARERMWIETANSKVSQPGATATALHPLLHTNSSTLDEQSYRSTFSGREFFILDHRKALVEVTLLEMARAAIAHATSLTNGSKSLELRDIQWAPDRVVANGKPLTAALFSDHRDRIQFEIQSTHGDGEGEPKTVVHCQGSAVFNAHRAPARLDLEQLKAQMRDGVLDSNHLDARLKELSLQRGASLRTLHAIHRGDQQQLVQLKLPVALANTRQDYVLHPAILDGIVQAAALLAASIAGTTCSGRVAELQTVRVFSPCTQEMYAWVRHSRRRAGERHTKLDIDLTDSLGTICVSLKSLAFDEEGAEVHASAGSEDFAHLLDSFYRAEPTVATRAEDEFQQILEDIL